MEVRSEILLQPGFTDRLCLKLQMSGPKLEPTIQIWGVGVFQNHSDLNNVRDACCKAQYIAGDHNLELWNPRDRGRVVANLNCGLFRQLFRQGRTEKGDDYCVIIGALAMQLGAIISDDDKEKLHDHSRLARMHPATKAQVEKALNEYKNNGEVWNFESPDYLDTMRTYAKMGGNPGSELIEPFTFETELMASAESFFYGGEAAVPGRSRPPTENMKGTTGRKRGKGKVIDERRLLKKYAKIAKSKEASTRASYSSVLNHNFGSSTYLLVRRVTV